MVDTYTKNKILKLDATTTTQPNITIINYEWKINDSVILENLKLVNINTNDLNLGENTISLRVLNSCGTWSENIVKTVNIINEVINMEQTLTIVVDKPTTSIDVIMQLTGTVIVTVKDPLGALIANTTCKIDTVTATTDVSGVATLNGISYGTKTLTVNYHPNGTS